MPPRKTPTATRLDSRISRVEATFERVRRAQLNGELEADLARYLCVLVAGFIERSLEDILTQHASKRAQPTVIRYVERTFYIGNINVKRLLQLVEHFDEEWRDRLDGYLDKEKRDAINSVYSNRNQIAHGNDVGLGLAGIQRYFECARDTVKFIHSVANP